jgi:uncharacterized phage protein (TIGR01671 family)
MLENKFRAWDKEDKRMIVHQQDFIPLIVTNFGVFKLDPTIKEDRWILINKDRFELMPYSGFKDVNGKEIYVGDVVIYNETQYKVSAFYGSYMLQRVDHEAIDYSDFPVSIFSTDSNKMQFIGSKNDYCVSFYELADNQQDFEGCLDCKVIGNIYDNP